LGGLLISEDDPVGSKYLKVIDLVTSAEVYEEYVNDFNSHFAVASKPVSATTFKRVWDWWLKEYRVRVRQKKNVSSKCAGTQLLKL